MVLEMFQVSEWEEGILRKPDSVRGADKKCSTNSHESGGGASGTGTGGSERERSSGNTQIQEADMTD